MAGELDAVAQPQRGHPVAHGVQVRADAGHHQRQLTILTRQHPQRAQQLHHASTCTVNHEPGHTFRLELTDGSDGKGGSIRLVLDTGYRLDAPLEGGNATVLAMEGAFLGSR